MGGPYQGNGTWALCGLMAVGMSVHFWNAARRARDAFQRSQLRRLAVFVALLFGGIAVYQVLTHPW